MRRLRTLIAKATAAVDNADEAIDNVEGGVMDVLDAVEELLEEGISFRIEIAGRPFPVKIIMEPKDES